MKTLTLVRMLSISSLVLGACADRGLKDERPRETVAPFLTVTAPERGTILANATTILVEGRASDIDSGLASVTINGTLVEVQADGSFEALVPAPTGMTLLHTEATDKDGNTENDTRAVLAGTLVPQAQAVTGGFAARINDQTLGAVGLIGADKLEATDLGAAVSPYNPIMDKGFSCLNVQLDVNVIDKSAVQLYLDPVSGGIAFDLTLEDLFVDMHAYFEAICINGSSSLVLSASQFHLQGTMAMSIGPDDRLAASIVSGAASFTDFNLDVGFIPGSVVELIVADIDQRVANAIANQLEKKVPQMIEESLGEFGVEKTVLVLQKELEIGLKPVVVDFTPAGGTIVLDSRFTIRNGTGGPGYLSTPVPLPALPASEAPGDGFRLAIADDVVNQALNAFWAAGVMENHFDIGSESDAGLGAYVDRIDVWLPLAPIAKADRLGTSALSVTAGDVMIDIVMIEAGAEYVVTRLALSAEIGLDVEVSAQNSVRLRTGAPIAYVDIIEEGITGPNPLDDSDIEILAGFVTGRLTTMIGAIVGEVPVPTFPSAEITNLSVRADGPQGGYVTLGGNVSPL